MDTQNSSLTSVAARIGIDHPVIQGPFGGGNSTPELAALVSNRGGLGSFGAVDLTPDEIAATAAQIRALTDRPFNLNLWVPRPGDGLAAPTARDLELSWPLFRPLFAELGLPMPDLTPPPPISFTEQVDAVLAARPRVFSFVFGIPPASVLAECRRLGIVTVGAATSVAEARALDAARVDLIVATGSEAGGHRVAFLGRAEDQTLGTFALTQLVARQVARPVIAAGGIAEADGVRAALALGAAAVQVGTAFLACRQSGIADDHRAALFSPAALETVLTRAFTGRLARGLRNRLTDMMSAGAAPFPVQGWFVARLKQAAIAAGRDDLRALYAGAVAPTLRCRDAATVMAELIAGTD